MLPRRTGCETGLASAVPRKTRRPQARHRGSPQSGCRGQNQRFGLSAYRTQPWRPIAATSCRVDAEKIRCRENAPLQFPSSARHRVVPEMFAVVVEYQLGLLGCGEPVMAGHLAFELTRPPTCIAQRKKGLLRTAVPTDVAQNLAARRHRHASVDIHGLVAPVFGAVHDKTEIGLHRAAGKNAQITFESRDILTGSLQQAGD